jgi:two-component system nitrate/nitrite response regulator NarL
MARTTPTFLVDSRDLSREGLRHVMAGSSFRVVAGVSCLSEVMNHPLGREKPALLIVYCHSINEPAPSDLLRFRDEHPLTHIAVLADHYDNEHLTTALGLGANAYLINNLSPENLFKSFELVMLGEVILPSAALPLVGREFAEPVDAADWGSGATLDAEGEFLHRQLSGREIDILQCLTDGDSNKLIARKLAIAEATVKVHIKAILRKIRVRNRTQAAIWAISNPVSPDHPAARQSTDDVRCPSSPRAIALRWSG